MDRSGIKICYIRKRVCKFSFIELLIQINPDIISALPLAEVELEEITATWSRLFDSEARSSKADYVRRGHRVWSPPSSILDTNRRLNII